MPCSRPTIHTSDIDQTVCLFGSCVSILSIHPLLPWQPILIYEYHLLLLAEIEKKTLKKRIQRLQFFHNV